ncbi:hypothetical protein HQ590_00915 [bacterium]|nr:hypothetical protein [bacterium]
MKQIIPFLVSVHCPSSAARWLAVAVACLLAATVSFSQEAEPAAAGDNAAATTAETTTTDTEVATTPETNAPAAEAAAEAPADAAATAEPAAAAEPAEPVIEIPEEPADPNRKAFASEDPDRVRTALEEAVVSLRRLARDDPAGFFARPWRQQKLIDWKEYELHYAEKEIEEPIYERYKTKAMVASGDSSVVTDRRVKEVTKIRLVGYRKVKRLIQDPNGPEVRKVRLPVYGPGGPDHLYSGFYGANAIAIYAQLLCGVPPEEEQFMRSWTRVLDCIEGYGMPDRTWDLAWLTVAAVNLPQDTALRKKTVQRLINKLLLGQAPDGPAKGMWGPVCLNTMLLGKMLAYEQELVKRELSSWEERLKQKPDSDYLKRKIRDAKALIRKFQVQYEDYTTIGTKFDGNTLVKPEQTFLMKVGWSFPDATFGGAPYSLYAERLADLDSTAIALFALQEVARARLLPDTTVVPKTLEGQAIIPPQKTSTIIARAMEALLRIQNQGRAFSVGISWTPITDFDFMGLPDISLGQPGVPVKGKKFADTDQEVTRLSAMRTHAALARAAVLAGGTGAAGPVLARARKMVTGLAEAHLEGKTNNLPPVGGLFSLQELAFESHALLTELGDPLETNRDLWYGFADQLIAAQSKTGAWPRPKENPHYSYIDGYKEEYYEPSLRPYIQARMRAVFDADQVKENPINKRETYDPKANLWRGRPFHYYHYSVQLPAEVVGTAYAMIFLAQGVRPPVMGYWAWDDNPPRTPLVRAVVNALSKDKNISFTYRLLPPDLPLRLIRELPMVYLAGTSAFSPARPEALPKLRYFLQNRGVLVAEGSAGGAGKTFLDQTRGAIEQLLPAAQATMLPELVEGVKLEGLLLDGSRILASFYPITNENRPPAGTIRLPEAARYTYELIQKTAPLDLLSAAYPIRWPLIEDMERREAEEKAKKEAEEAAKKAAEETGAVLE